MTTTTSRPHVDPSDAVLVERAVEGDRGAFTTLFRRHVDAVHDHVARWCGDAALAADATQEAFMALLDSLDTIRDGQAVLAWLVRTARNRATDQLRRLARERASDELDRSLLVAVDTDRAGSPERVAEAVEAADWLWDVARGLDERTFSVLDLTVRRGLSAPELAEALGTTHGNAHVLVHRMRQRVGTLFGAAAFLRAADDCTALTALSARLDDPLDLPGARAVERHAEHCEQCVERRRRAVAPLRAHAAFADVAAPPSVHAAVEQAADAHFGPGAPGGGSAVGGRLARWSVRVLVVLGVATTAAALAVSPVEEPVPVVTAVLADPTATVSPSPAPSPTPSVDAVETTTPSPADDEAPDEPSDPDPGTAPSPGPDEPAPPLVVEVVEPATGSRLAVDGVGPTPGRAVGVVAAVTGADDAQVEWTSASVEGALLVGATGTVTLPGPTTCGELRHDLVATATAVDGRVARDTTEVTLVAACPPLEVAIRAPADGAVALASDRAGGPVAATVQAAAVGAGDDGAWTWRWTSDRTDGTLLDRADGALRLAAPDCVVTTHRLTVTATDPATGRTGTAVTSVVVEPRCP